MNREAAVLGTPVWSMFEGRLGGGGRAARARGPAAAAARPGDIVVTRKDRAAAPALRDPAELLRLALPWVP